MGSVTHMTLNSCPFYTWARSYPRVYGSVNTVRGRVTLEMEWISPTTQEDCSCPHFLEFFTE